MKPRQDQQQPTAPAPTAFPFAILTPWGWLGCVSEQQASRVARESRKLGPAQRPVEQPVERAPGR